MLTRPRRKVRSTLSAFTLIEIAGVLVVVGLIASFALKMTQPTDCYAPTKAQMNTIRGAIDQFVIANRRYPIPAGKALGVTHPDFGKETAVASIGAATGTVDANGLYYGALPFQALGLPSSFAADCWGNKFTYVVSKTLVDTAGFAAASNVGSIVVNNVSYDMAAASAITNEATKLGTYVLISHGADALGATKRNATTAADCNGSTATRLDKQNCQTTANTFTVAPFSSGTNPDTNPTFFDDIVIFNGNPSNCVIY